MGYKSIVVSIKHGSKIVSREFERRPAQMIHQLPASFFANPELSEIFTSRKKVISHPFLEDGERTGVRPGTVGWIGLDVDRRWILDIQGMQPLDNFALSPERGKPLVLPEPLRERCEQAPWHYRVASLSNDGPWLEGPTMRSQSDWDQWKEGLFARRDGTNFLPMEFRPQLPVGWRILNAEADFEQDERGRRVSHVLHRMMATGWKEELLKGREQWEEFLIDYYALEHGSVKGWTSRREERRLDSVLPVVGTTPSRRIRM